MSIIVAEVNASTALSYIGNGFGSVIVAYGGDIATSGSEVYTATTCTATWANPVTGAAVGNLVVTQDGHWGVLQSNASATVATVDKWRTRMGGVGVPTAGQDCRVINGSCVAAGAAKLYLHRIIVTNTAAGSLTVRDVWGNVLYTHPVLGTASPHVVEFATGNEYGLVFDRLVSFQSSAATLNGTFVFGY